MKKTLFLSYSFIICLFLMSCGNDTQSSEVDSIRGDISNTVVYSREHMLITEVGQIEGLFVEDERIYYYFRPPGSQEASYLVVASVLQDGTDKEYIEISFPATGRQIYAVHFTSENNIGILTSENGEIFYSVYNRSSIELHRQSFGDLSPDEDGFFFPDYINFTDNGKIILSTSTGSGTVVYILDIETGSNEMIFTGDRIAGISALDSNRTVIALYSNDGIAFQIIDNEASSVDTVYQSSISGINVINNVIPAKADSPFDLLLSNNINLYGYSLETKEQTILLNWLETGFSNISNASVDLLSDGNIVLLSESRYINDVWEADLYILAPGSREGESDKIAITLGGFWIYGDVLEAVINFNNESHTHQIIVHDYINDAESWDAAVLRLKTELITGKGPDIIYNPDNAFIDNSFMVDLYTLIDADDELSKSDFFPNILEALEAPDGSLAMVVDTFQIGTLYGIADYIGHISSWTPQELLTLMDSVSHMHAPFGRWMDREGFIRTMILYSGDEYIDWSSRRAKLDSDAFKNILEIARRLPDSNDIFDINDEPVDDRTKMLRGEQLLTQAVIANPNSFVTLPAGFEEIILIGFPTSEGGASFITLDINAIGINASSNHIEEAWSFVRKALLPPEELDVSDPSVSYKVGFPIRIDAYDNLIEICKTPLIVNGVKKPRFTVYSPDDSSDILEIDVLSQTDADDLRLFIEDAKPIGKYIRDELWYHLRNDLNAFFAGDRTAEDTARIIQSRIQTYLDELR